MFRPILLGSLLTALLLTACDDTFIDPFDNDARYYTVYGFIDAQERQQQIRIVPVTRTPERITDPDGANGELDAKVTTTDLVSGEVTTWTHSLEPLADGTYAHIYRARFLVRPGRTYRLVIERSDGKQTVAETTVPLFSRDNLITLDTLQFSPDSSTIDVNVIIDDIVSPWEIDSFYLFTNQSVNEGTLNGRFFVPQGRRGDRTSDGWRMTLDLTQDVAVAAAEIDSFRQAGVYSNTPQIIEAMGIQVRMLDNAWDPPEGIFDPEVLAQPDVLSNVENGYGFFGSVGWYRQEWGVSPDFSALFDLTFEGMIGGR